MCSFSQGDSGSMKAVRAPFAAIRRHHGPPPVALQPASGCGTRAGSSFQSSLSAREARFSDRRKGQTRQPRSRTRVVSPKRFVWMSMRIAAPPVTFTDPDGPTRQRPTDAAAHCPRIPPCNRPASRPRHGANAQDPSRDLRVRRRIRTSMTASPRRKNPRRP